jgi:hypothetical protein
MSRAFWAAIVWREAVLCRRRGVANSVALADRLGRKYGPSFKVPKLLKEMAENGEAFHGRFDPYAKMDEAAQTSCLTDSKTREAISGFFRSDQRGYQCTNCSLAALRPHCGRQSCFLQCRQTDIAYNASERRPTILSMRVDLRSCARGSQPNWP